MFTSYTWESTLNAACGITMRLYYMLYLYIYIHNEEYNSNSKYLPWDKYFVCVCVIPYCILELMLNKEQRPNGEEYCLSMIYALH